MKHRGVSVLVCLVLSLVLGGGGLAEARGPGAAAQVPQDARLTAKLRNLLAKAGSKKHGVVVQERGQRGRLLVSLGGSRSLIPASVAKIMTGAAALDWLGPQAEFTTVVHAAGRRGTSPRLGEGGVLQGNLLVRGGGDPTLGSPDHGSGTLADLKPLAREVRARGVRVVTGDLVLDDRAFDADFQHADWTKEDKTRTYGAGVAALAFREGCVLVEATGASQAGAPARVAFPASSGVWSTRNRVSTVAGARGGLGVTWSGSPATMTVRGSVAPKKAAGARAPVPDPALHFGGALKDALAAQGIEIRGRIRRAAPGDEVGGPRLATHTSLVPDAVRVMNRRSSNFHASMVFKAVGAELGGRGSWASGEAAIRDMAENRLIDTEGMRIVDGSGLSPTNRITANALVGVLAAFERDPLRGPVLLESLPTSGKTGTLRRRLRGRGVLGRVHAKTGTLNDVRVRSLAGYIDGRGDKPGLVFAIVLNGRGANTGLIDQLVTEMAKR